MTILITGATGNVGRELVKVLVERGVRPRVMVRSLARSAELFARTGVELVEGDFDDPPSLARAAHGVERAFLLTPSSERAEAQQCAFVDAARAQGVRHVVKLSQWAADEGSPVRFLRYHAAVERVLRTSGLGFTLLRPNLFMQGLLGFRGTIASKGQFFAAAGEAPISVVDVRDIAAVAATTLLETGHEGATYDLTGPEALSHAEMASQLGAALGKPVAFVDVPPSAMRDALLGAGFPAWQAEGLIEDYAHYHRGEAAQVTPTVAQQTGRPARAFADFAREHANAFR